MTGLSVDANISASVDLFGKNVEDLQSGIMIANNAITGTLLYVDDYTGFSSSARLQKGNFLAIHANAPEGAVITVEVVGGESGPVTLDEDRIIVDRIASTTQKIKVTVSKSGHSRELVYSLAGLTLNES